MMSVVQEVQEDDDDESPRCVMGGYDEDEDEDETAELSSFGASTDDSSSRLTGNLGRLVVDLKMELAEALAKVDDLTLANARLERERDRAREHIRWLRGRPSQPSTTTSRRASDGGAPVHFGAEESPSSSSSSFVRDMFQSSLSNLQDEAIHVRAIPAPDTCSASTTHESSSRPDVVDDWIEEEHIEALHITEHGQPILLARDVGSTTARTLPTGQSLASSLRRLSIDICSTIQPLSSETFQASTSSGSSDSAPSSSMSTSMRTTAHADTSTCPNANGPTQQQDGETDRAAGLPLPAPRPSLARMRPRRSSMPDLRSRRTSYILAQADRLQLSSLSSSQSFHGEGGDRDNNIIRGSSGSGNNAPRESEAYHEYTVKTIFGQDDAAVRRQQRRNRRRRKSLVSSLEIAQARISAAGTTSSSSEEDGMGADSGPILPSSEG